MSGLIDPRSGHHSHRDNIEANRRRLQAAISATHPPTSGRRRSYGRAIIASIAALVALVSAGYFLVRHDVVDMSRFGIELSSVGKISPNAPTNSPIAPTSETIIFSGQANQLAAAPGNTVDEDDSAEPLVWIVSTVRTAKSDGATDGVSIKLPSSVSEDLEARQIRVTISAARKDGADESSPFAISYSTDRGSSGWRVFRPTKEFKDFSFTYAVPNIAGGTHFVGIWSDIAGRSIPLAVRRISIAVLR